jgi:NAD(P)-dependent dehydrogenase (short-subunit alcohol dehydrogenase family)
MSSSLHVVRASNNALVKNQPVTAVFVGGTSGIGEYAVRSLASTHGSSGRGLRVYIVGRNEASANAIISDCKKVCPTGEFHFIPAKDLSLIREVDRVCVEITRSIQSERAYAGMLPASIELLVMTQAYFAFGSKLERQGLKSPISLATN